VLPTKGGPLVSKLKKGMTFKWQGQKRSYLKNADDPPPGEIRW
jgi:hypothetical protein